MDFEFIDKIKKDLVRKEKTCDNINSLNKSIKNKNDIIMHVNIRSMSANFDKLHILLESLTNKPSIVICTETYVQVNYKLYELEGYKSYYNGSKINQNDGVIVFVSENIVHEIKIIESGRIKIINVHIKLSNNSSIELSAVYRSHDIPKTEFILDLNKFLSKKRNLKNHLVIGDFNINLLELDRMSQEFLCNFLDKGYIPGFVGITRPSVGNCKGSCIDNIYIKTDSISACTYKLKHSLTDHYPIFVAINKIKTKDSGPIVILDYKKLRNIAKTRDWNSIMSIHDPNIATNQLISEIKKCMEQAKTQKRKDINKRRKLWITDAISKSCETKEFLYNLWKMDVQNEQLRQQYTNYAKILDKPV